MLIMEKNRLNDMLHCMFTSSIVDVFEEEAIYREFISDDYRSKDDNFQDGNNSVQLYGNVIYEDKYNHVRKSKPVLIKLTTKSWYRKFSSPFSYINEMNFYTKVVPSLSNMDEDVSFASLFPKFYHGGMIFTAQGDQCSMVFEDLNARGYRMSEKKSFLDYEHLTLMIRKLGQLHAYSYKAKNTVPNLFYLLASNTLEANPTLTEESLDVLTASGQRGLEYLRQDRAYAQYVPRISEMLKNANQIYKRILTEGRANRFSVIIHGDYLRSNVMFKYENGIPVDVLIIDMATYRFASPVIDLALVLYNNADQKTRIEYWDSLIDEYYDSLKGTFSQNEIPSKCEILSEFNGTSFYAYLIASVFLQYIIAADDGTLPTLLDLNCSDMTLEKEIECNLNIGGEPATQALSNVLKDMIDRGFICN